MKRIFLFILSLVIILLMIILSKYNQYIEKYNSVKAYNAEYEQYLDKEILGTDIATVINKAVDDNEKAFIKKDDENRYIQNDTNSINIEVKITDLDEETIYTMETLYNGGMNQFVTYYGQILFKCAKINYNTSGQVSYMLFEQISS